MILRHLFISLCFLLCIPAAVVQAGEEYQILGASYGTDAHNMEVTDQLKNLASQDRTVKITNALFGYDPDPGRTKKLRIFARSQSGQARTFEYKEGSYIDGSQFTGWGSGNWGQQGWKGGWNGEGRGQERARGGDYVILQASYGTRERNVDVTQRLRELARQNRTFRMGNNTFGVDPDPGRIKMLRVYTRGPNGENRTFDFRENSEVDGNQFADWGGGSWGRGGWKGGWGDEERGRGRHQGHHGGGLTIISARYGEGNRTIDVTQQVRREIRDGRLDFTANNYLAGRDPAPGRTKYLTITYTGEDGRRQVSTIQEGRQVRIP